MKMGRPEILIDKEKEIIKRLYPKMKIRDISEKIGITYSIVYNFLKSNDLLKPVYKNNKKHKVPDNHFDIDNFQKNYSW